MIWEGQRVFKPLGIQNHILKHFKGLEVYLECKYGLIFKLYKNIVALLWPSCLRMYAEVMSFIRPNSVVWKGEKLSGMQTTFRPDLRVTVFFQNGMQIEKIPQSFESVYIRSSLKGNGAGKFNVGMLICRKAEMMYLSSQGKRSNVSWHV